MNFENSARLYAQATEVLANGVSSGLRRRVSTPPLYFKRASGPYFYDVDGNELLDYTLGWGPLIAGNAHPAIHKAVVAELQKFTSLGAQHEGEIALARRIIAAVPGVEQVIFSNSGSEAVQAALRVARAATGRGKFIKFEGHYHGWFNNVLVSYHPTPEQLGRAAPTCGGQPAAEYQDTLVLPWNDKAALERAFSEHKGQIAAVITEPILANSGSCMPEPGFLEAVIALCKTHGAISIFDEVITGFRIALGGAREYFHLRPDMSVYAKAMAGGFSISAVGGSRAVFDALRDGRTIHAGTYNGNPVNIAAALATLELLSVPGSYERMHRHGQAIREELERCARAKGLALVTSGTGTIFSVHFGLAAAPKRYADILKADAALYDNFRALMLQEGLLLLPEGRWYVGLTHGEPELGKTRDAVRRCFDKLKA